MEIVKIKSKSQITIPSELMKLYKLNEGDYLKIIDNNGLTFYNAAIFCNM